MTTFFTSDTHFGDAYVIVRSRRPFANARAMDEALVARWNETVGPEDEVWHLGDFAGKMPETAVARLLDSLAGRKHLIVGNNDPPQTLRLAGWASVQHYAEIEVEGRHLVLCHYPFRTWNGIYRGGVEPARPQPRAAQKDHAAGRCRRGRLELPARDAHAARGPAVRSEGRVTSAVAERPVRTAKRSLDIDAVFHKLRRAVAGLPKAAMFELRDRGYATPFEQLVGSLISARTRDETTVVVCERLFRVARTPEQFAALEEKRLAALLHGATFPEPKARDLKAIAQRLMEKYGGGVPASAAQLMEFRGVGPKVAALTLAVGFGQPAIAVDIHVHRVTNRWGYVRTATPEQTMAALLEKLPKRYWIEINERLVPFGKAICMAVHPHCPNCPLLAMCRQVSVVNPR